MTKPISQTLDAVSIGKRIKLARTSRSPKMSQKELAAQIEAADASIVGHWERGRNTPNLENAAKTAKALGVRADWLLYGQEPKGDQPSSTTNGATPGGAGQREIELRQTNMPDRASWLFDVPVLGTSDAQPDGSFEITSTREHPIDRVRRPPILTSVGSAYAIYCQSPFMSPVFEIGDPVWIHPSRPANDGDYALIILTGESGAAFHVHLLRVTKRTADKITAEQLSPPRKFEFAASRIKNIHHVIRPNDLLRG